MDSFRAFLDFTGYAATIFTVGAFCYAIVLWMQGILPAIVRLGRGLAGRKIALFAKGDNVSSLQSLLIDSGLFRTSNIIHITTDGDIGKCEAATLFLVHWPDWRDTIDEILRHKADGTALVVYAPQESGPIPAEVIGKFNSKRNFVLSNFRGRLINDLVVCMITTSYEKK